MVVLLLLCLAIGLGLHRLWQRRRCHASLRDKQNIVLAELSAIRALYQEDGYAAAACAALSSLLRRVCLLCFSRAEFASLHGAAWLTFLRSKHAWPSNRLELLMQLAYKPHGTASQQDIQRLLQDSEDWVMAVIVEYG